MRLVCLALLAGCGDGATSGMTPDLGPLVPPHGGTGAPVTASGKAFVFGPIGAGEGDLVGASLGVAEAPSLAAKITADGTFQIQVPGGGECSFTVRQPGFHDTQSAVLAVGAQGIDMVGFQVPSDKMYKLLGNLLNLESDATKCQIATTVSAKGTAPYGGDALGVPGVTVAIESLGGPALGAESGPVYFNYLKPGVIAPDRGLTATTVDGGVLYLNVPPGDYVLSATKAGTQFTTAKVRCRAGWLVNAAPPRGLQEI